MRPHIPLNVRTIDLRSKRLCFTVQPTTGSELPEPVSMAGFSFQINQRTGRARIVVEYTYPDQPIFGIDGGAGPKPTYIQLPGLTYAPTFVKEGFYSGREPSLNLLGLALSRHEQLIMPRMTDGISDGFVRSILSSTSTKDFITAPGMWCQDCYLSGLCWRGTLYRPDSRPKVIHAIGRYLFRAVILLLVGIRRTRLRIDEGG